MADQLIVFVSGAGRGIGFALVQAYLLRSNTTVIASTRSPSPQLVTLPTGHGSKLLQVTIESTSFADPKTAIAQLQASGITHLDIVIANAGVSPPVESLDTVDLEEMASTFSINALGPLALFQASKPLLKKSSAPKWVSVSSAAGSIGGMEAFGSHIAPAYCVSKAALNWITLLVATDMGNKTAALLGLKKAPYTQEQSAALIVELISNASRETTSGKFINVVKGEEIPW
ncbi:putative sterigmatocystin biosynthesis ketoreductase [Lachnellula suecica]|uniref:Putative sterigmatocystin biosynthesis ketoreductase n=1 Tax=Lachnellula suecica TaxID=602035 RepID=A0A8T9CBZ6_9HELO|nr:putative sterigmatocystin biosynthesis ketoreductase [Lachnellula suecica]